MALTRQRIVLELSNYPKLVTWEITLANNSIKCTNFNRTVPKFSLSLILYRECVLKLYSISTEYITRMKFLPYR